MTILYSMFLFIFKSLAAKYLPLISFIYTLRKFLLIFKDAGDNKIHWKI